MALEVVDRSFNAGCGRNSLHFDTSCLHTTPPLPATVILGGEPIARMVRTADENADEFVPQDTLAQSALIKSRGFLRTVADSLSLRLKVLQYPRSSIFDTVVVDSLAPSGRYRFEIDKKHGNTYSIFRKDSVQSLRRLFHEELAAAGTMDTLNSLQLPGVRFRFTRLFLQHPYNFKFSILHIQETVEALRNSISVTREDRSFSITVTGNDYTLSATTANTIADKFVEKNIRLRQTRSENMRAIFTQQIIKAKSEMAESEENLRSFRTENPTLGLSTRAEELLSSSLEAERTNDSIDESINSARKLQGKLAGAAKQDLPEACSEILTFLSDKRINAAPFLTNELSGLIAESHRLDGVYDKNHPLVLKNQAAIKQIVEKAAFELQNFIEGQKQRKTRQLAEILEFSDKIQALPAEELKLAQISRQQQINADIYARMLDKFYQATVSDVTDIPDFYVMDYASPSIPPPPPKLDQKVIVLCLFIGLMLLFGPMIVVDLTSKTVRTENELKKILDIDILETIPKITLKRGAGDGPASNGLSDILIVNNERFKNDYVNDLFRLLRSKIHHRLLSGGLDKTILITSLESNVGKSTLAANIAIAMAQQNLKTVIIDGDLRLGTIHRFFNIDKSPGLSEFLTGDDQTGNNVTPLSIHHLSAIPMLSVISSGEPRKNATELIASDRLRSLIKTLAGKNYVVIFDSPPIGIVADALSINRFFSHYLLVIRAAQTNVFDLREKLADLPLLSSKLMGVVLNFATINRKISYYKRSKYYFQAQEKTEV